MNVAKAIELAFADLIRKQELGAGVHVRAWQSLRADTTWDVTKDREFPAVDIRTAPQQFDMDAGSTMFCETAILCGTVADDDRDHAAVSALYEAVQGACDALYADFRGGTGTLLTAFVAAITLALGSEGVKFSFGGLTFGGSMAPYDEGGSNMLGLTMRVHFSRSDF
jgi:hypothetical protein